MKRGASIPIPLGGQLEQLPAGVRAEFAGRLANAFGHTFMWAFGIALLAVVPAVLLVRAERSAR